MHILKMRDNIAVCIKVIYIAYVGSFIGGGARIIIGIINALTNRIGKNQGVDKKDKSVIVLIANSEKKCQYANKDEK